MSTTAPHQRCNDDSNTDGPAPALETPTAAPKITSQLRRWIAETEPLRQPHPHSHEQRQREHRKSGTDARRYSDEEPAITAVSLCELKSKYCNTLECARLILSEHSEAYRDAALLNNDNSGSSRDSVTDVPLVDASASPEAAPIAAEVSPQRLAAGNLTQRDDDDEGVVPELKAVTDAATGTYAPASVAVPVYKAKFIVARLYAALFVLTAVGSAEVEAYSSSTRSGVQNAELASSSKAVWEKCEKVISESAGAMVLTPMHVVDPQSLRQHIVGPCAAKLEQLRASIDETVEQLREREEQQQQHGKSAGDDRDCTVSAQSPVSSQDRLERSKRDRGPEGDCNNHHHNGSSTRANKKRRNDDAKKKSDSAHLSKLRKYIARSIESLLDANLMTEMQTSSSGTSGPSGSSNTKCGAGAGNSAMQPQQRVALSPGAATVESDAMAQTLFRRKNSGTAQRSNAATTRRGITDITNHYASRSGVQQHPQQQQSVTAKGGVPLGSGLPAYLLQKRRGYVVRASTSAGAIVQQQQHRSLTSLGGEYEVPVNRSLFGSTPQSTSAACSKHDGAPVRNARGLGAEPLQVLVPCTPPPTVRARERPSSDGGDVANYCQLLSQSRQFSHGDSAVDHSSSMLPQRSLEATYPNDVLASGGAVGGVPWNGRVGGRTVRTGGGGKDVVPPTP